MEDENQDLRTSNAILKTGTAEDQHANQPSARGKQKCDEVTQKQWQSEESDCLSSLRVSSNTGSVNLVVVDGTPYRPCLLCPPVFLALCGRIAAHMPGCQRKEVTKTTLWQQP